MLSLAWQTAVASQPGVRFPARVTSVVDGDSLEVERSGELLRLRLHGIDCPEWDQPYGRAARRFTAGLASGELVSVVPIDEDEYGRVVAEVFLPDGRSLNRELVRAGLAWWYRRYADDVELKRLEAEARKGRRGLWGDPDPVPPWVWRHRGPRR